MRLFSASDAELISYLQGERTALLARVGQLELSLEAARKETIAALDRLSEVKAQPAKVEPQPPTREQIARMLRIPEHLIDQIDLDRIGVQVAPSKRHQ